MSFLRKYRAVLFDMDGTLVDSANDLAAAVNELRRTRGLLPLPADRFRRAASAGSPALLKEGLGLTPESEGYLEARDEFFAAYEKRCSRDPALFPGIAEALAKLDDAGLPWGIVTNKPQAFAEKITAASPALAACRVVVGSRVGLLPKPEPDALLVALSALGEMPEKALYCGDDARDILAGKRAGTATCFAGWGYTDLYAPEVLALGPNRILPQPADLLAAFCE